MILELLNKYSDIFIGFSLAVVPLVIAEFYRRWRNRSDFRRGLITELQETKKVLVLFVFQFKDCLGELDSELLNWCCKRFKEDKETSQFRGIDKLSGCDNNALHAYNTAQKAKNITFRAKSINTFYLESKIDNLSLMSKTEQALIIQIVRRVKSLNEEAQINNIYYDLTFDSSLSPENHRRVVINIENCHRNISKQSQIISDLIAELFNEMQRKSFLLQYHIIKEYLCNGVLMILDKDKKNRGQ